MKYPTLPFLLLVFFFFFWFEKDKHLHDPHFHTPPPSVHTFPLCAKRKRMLSVKTQRPTTRPPHPKPAASFGLASLPPEKRPPVTGNRRHKFREGDPIKWARPLGWESRNGSRAIKFAHTLYIKFTAPPPHPHLRPPPYLIAWRSEVSRYMPVQRHCTLKPSTELLLTFLQPRRETALTSVRST